MAKQRLTALPLNLRQFTDDPIPNDRALRAAAVNLRIPAHQVNGMWHFETADLPAIAEGLGLRPKAAPPARPRARRSAEAVAA